MSAGSVILTEGGNIRITEGGLYRVTEDFAFDSDGVDGMYDFIAAIEEAAPGVVVQRIDIDAVAVAWAANGFNVLTDDEIIALVGPLPPYPTGMPRFPDSDGGMQSPDGWCITTDGKVVFG